MSDANAGSKVSFYGLEVVSTRLAILIDISGSMGEASGSGATRIQVARARLRETLAGLPDGTHFNVIAFATGVHEMGSSVIALTPESRDAAITFVNSLRSDGGTNIHDALDVAFEDPGVDTIYLLSDGDPNKGRITDPGAIRDEVKRWNAGRGVKIHSIAVGQDHPLLRGLSTDSGGKYVRVN